MSCLGRQTIVDSTTTIGDVLLAAHDCYRRADQLVRVTGSSITPVLSAAELAGLGISGRGPRKGVA